jgi:ABC-2 type transport system ATP-binding protein
VAIVDRGKLLELDTPEGLKRRVGKGDTLELALTAAGRPLGEDLQKRVKERFPDAAVGPEELTLSKLAVIDELPAILDALKQIGLTVAKVHLRESTLEDVFISLTGRRLRE